MLSCIKWKKKKKSKSTYILSKKYFSHKLLHLRFVSITCLSSHGVGCVEVGELRWGWGRSLLIIKGIITNHFVQGDSYLDYKWTLFLSDPKPIKETWHNMVTVIWTSSENDFSQNQSLLKKLDITYPKRALTGVLSTMNDLDLLCSPWPALMETDPDLT